MPADLILTKNVRRPCQKIATLCATTIRNVQMMSSVMKTLQLGRGFRRQIRSQKIPVPCRGGRIRSYQLPLLVFSLLKATVDSQWLELLQQDLKGSVSALQRTKKRVCAVVTTELPFLVMKEFPADQENDPNLLPHRQSITRKTRWMALFNQLVLTLSEEESQLESWLNQVRDLAITL